MILSYANFQTTNYEYGDIQIPFVKNGSGIGSILGRTGGPVVFRIVRPC